MESDSTEKAAKLLAELNGLHAKATPAPWTWRNAHGGEPELVCPKHGMLLVMDAVRHGMNRADLRFAQRSPNDRGGLMRKASDLLPKTGKCVPDYPQVDNPDMAIIASLRTNYPALASLAAEALAWREWHGRGAHRDDVPDTGKGSLWSDVFAARAASDKALEAL